MCEIETDQRPLQRSSVGSTLSLKYLRSDWVAPLGSTSLVFNFLFAKWLVGTREWSTAKNDRSDLPNAADIADVRLIRHGQR